MQQQKLDRDTQEVIDFLGRSAAISGLSQAAFARALGTSAPRMSTYLTGATRPSAWFCVRAHRLARALADASERRLMSAPETAVEIRRALRTGETAWAWRMLLQGRDHLRLMLTDRIYAELDLTDSWEALPGTTGDNGFDALLAALAFHEFDEAGRSAPGWTRIEPLEDEWRPPHPFLSPERVVDRTPDWLRRLRIYVPERDLATA
ncbi:MAG: helix-turn-helix domain-containing protein [Nocardioides sp.]|uniref:helix-turn-helix domain-containing protein n=1 Tax=Nocardioides sp. TaxID=35761 RepID=UPI003D6BE181